MTSDYAVIETVPSAEDFCRLRRISGMSPRPLEGVVAGLLLRRPYSLAGNSGWHGSHRR